MISHSSFESFNYSPLVEDPYGSKNIQLESFLSRTPYQLIPNRQVGCYSSSYKTVQLDTLCIQFLARMMELQKRIRKEHPLKFRKQQRLVFGGREIEKFLTLGRVKSLFIATNLSDQFTTSNEYCTILQIANEKQIPIVWSCSRNKLGELLASSVSVSMIAVMFDDGVTDLHKEIIQLSQKLKQEWIDDLLKMNPNPYSVSGESLLWICCYYGHLECVKLIVALYPELLSRPDTKYGMLPAHVCSSNGHFGCFQLVGKYLYEEKTFQRKDCCYLAVENGHFNILKFILDKWKKQKVKLFDRLTEKYITGLSLAMLSIIKEQQKCFTLIVECLENDKESIQEFIIEWMQCAVESKNVSIWNMLLSLFNSDIQLLAPSDGVIARCFIANNINILRMILHFVKQHLPKEETMHSFLIKIQINAQSIFHCSKGTIFERDFEKYCNSE